MMTVACKNKHFTVVALVAVLAGCGGSEFAEDTDSVESNQTAEARVKLSELGGAWKVSERTMELVPMPERVVVTISDESVDPTTGATQGTFLRIMREDNPQVPAIDRAPFVDVDEGRKCENVSMGGGSSVTVCHTTTLEGNLLTHTVDLTQWQGYILPTGWSKAVQTLALQDGKLRYTYTIDGDLSHDVTLVR